MRLQDLEDDAPAFAKASAGKAECRDSVARQNGAHLGREADDPQADARDNLLENRVKAPVSLSHVPTLPLDVNSDVPSAPCACQTPGIDLNP